MMRVIDNGINMFQVRYDDTDGIPRLWRLNPNWTFIIVGTVILLAVVLDQVVHIVQAARRLRHGAAAPDSVNPGANPPTAPATSRDSPAASTTPAETP